MTVPDTGGSSSQAERRVNPLLRLLVDEMMAQVRQLSLHVGPWTAGERAQAEEALARIMSRVRDEAMRPGPLPPAA